MAPEERRRVNKGRVRVDRSSKGIGHFAEQSLRKPEPGAVSVCIKIVGTFRQGTFRLCSSCRWTIGCTFIVFKYGAAVGCWKLVCKKAKIISKQFQSNLEDPKALEENEEVVTMILAGF